MARRVWRQPAEEVFRNAWEAGKGEAKKRLFKSSFKSGFPDSHRRAQKTSSDVAPDGKSGKSDQLVAEIEGVERHGFGERHAENAHDEDFAESGGIAANGFNGFVADETYAESSTQAAEAALETEVDFALQASVSGYVSSGGDHRS
jgi:hypothetical protein